MASTELKKNYATKYYLSLFGLPTWTRTTSYPLGGDCFIQLSDKEIKINYDYIKKLFKMDGCMKYF